MERDFQRDFQVDVTNHNHGVVLTLQGELDISSTQTLEAELHRVSDNPRVIVDLSGLEFIDSTGLGLLVSAHQRMRDEHNELVLLGGEGQVKRLLELTGLSQQLTIVQNLDDLSGDS